MANVIVQNRRITPTIIRENRYAFRFVGDRSFDSQINDQPGQDFIAYNATSEKLCFVLCDGVSQSFMGDVGARLLGEAVLIWLENSGRGSSDTGDLQASLKKHLNSIVDQATAQVSSQVIPENLPYLLREVLEEKRSLGSQSMFIGVRIDLPGSKFTHGRLICTWMGDSRLRFWEGNNEQSQDLGDQFQTSQRWSTLSGLVNGDPHFFIDSLYGERGKSKYTRVLAYSDGFAVLDSIHESLTNAQLDDIVDQLAEQPNSDDVSLFEFWLGQPPLGLDTPALSPVRILIPEVTTTTTLPLPLSSQNEEITLSSDSRAQKTRSPNVSVKLWQYKFFIIGIPILIVILGLIWFGKDIIIILLQPTTPTPSAGTIYQATTISTILPSTTWTVTSTRVPKPSPTITVGPSSTTPTFIATLTSSPNISIHPSQTITSADLTTSLTPESSMSPGSGVTITTP